MYSVAGFLIASAAHVVLSWRDRPVRSTLIRATAATAALLSVLMLLTALVMGRSGFSYWTDLAAVVSSYRWSMAFPLEWAVKVRLVATAVVSLLTLATAWRWSASDARSLARRPVFFPA